MKKICIVLAFLTIFLFIGCGSDEDEGDTVADTDTSTDTDTATDTGTDSGDSQPGDTDTSDSGENTDNGDSASDDTETPDEADTSDNTDSTDDNETSDEDEISDDADSADDTESNDDADSSDDADSTDDADSSDDADSTDDADSSNDEDQIVADPCEGVSCGNNGVCSVENGSAVCNCPNGYYGNGTTCAPITSQQPGWIGVQWPFTISKMKNDDPEMVYGRIYVEGTTGCPFDAHPQQNSWIAQLGYKSGSGSAEYPIIAGTWTWINADFNQNYTCLDGEIWYDNHEYMASFPTNETGNFIYIFRFSLDNGATWWYADKGIGENMEPGPKFITSGTNYPGKATIN